MREYSASGLPNFVLEFIGSWRLELSRIAPDVWCLWSEESDRAILVRASRAHQAREAARDFVAHAAPRTDRRRKKWIYT